MTKLISSSHCQSLDIKQNALKSVYPDDSSSSLIFLCVVFVLQLYGHTLADA